MQCIWCKSLWCYMTMLSSWVYVAMNRKSGGYDVHHQPPAHQVQLIRRIRCTHQQNPWDGRIAWVALSCMVCPLLLKITLMLKAEKIQNRVNILSGTETDLNLNFLLNMGFSRIMHTIEQCILWAWIYGWTKGAVRVWFMLLLDCVSTDQTEAFDAHCRTLPLPSVYSLLANNPQCQCQWWLMPASVWMNIWRLVCLVALQNNLSNWDAESHCIGWKIYVTPLTYYKTAKSK